MTLIDLTQAVAHGTVTYPGLPPRGSSDHVSSANRRPRWRRSLSLVASDRARS